MSALGSLVVKLALNHAEYTQGLDRSSQEALKFAQNSQKSFDQAEQSAKEFFGNVAAGAVGVITSIVGIDAAITRTKQNIDVLASLDDAAQKTGSSVEDLSRIQKTAKNFGDDFSAIEQSISRLSKGLGSFDDEGNQALRALDAIGVSARDTDGQLRTSAEVYIDVAKALQQYKDGAEKTAVVNALFGKSGADQLPILNNLARGIDDVTGASAGSAAQADEFNDALARSGAAIDGIFGKLAIDLLPTLLSISSAINVTSGEMRDFGSANSAVAITLKGLVLIGFTIIDTFNGVARSIGAAVGQFVALSTLDMGRFVEIEDELNRMNKESREEFDKFFDTVLNGDKKLAAAATDGGLKKTIDFALNMPSAQREATQSTRQAIDASQAFMEKLQQEADQLGKTSAEIRKMQAAKLGLSDAADPLIDQIESETAAAKLLEAQLSKVKSITQANMTADERFSQTIAELNDLMALPDGGLSPEVYSRAVQKAQSELESSMNATKDSGKQAANEWDNIWRTSENTARMAFTAFAAHGTSAMESIGQSIKTAIIDTLYQLTVRKWMINIGASLGMGGTGSSSGGFDILSAGSNLLSAGRGIGSLLGRGASVLGFSSFGAGASGAASAGVFGAGGMNFLGGSGTALGAGAEFGSMASLGAGLPSAAGPLAALAASVGIGSMIAGDKKMFGMGGTTTAMIGAALGGPIGALIGGGINALFGYGPRKFRQEVAIGDVSAEGFDGRFTRVDRAKGGLLVGNKHWEYASPDSAAFQEVFDTAIKGYATSAKDFAKNLGLSTEAVTGYSKTIRLESEKGKALTGEQISSFLLGIGNEFAQGIMPTVDTLKKAGEDSLTTLGRLSNEFTSLSDAATILGKSVAESRAFISGASFEGRTGFVDAAGGIDALNQKAAFFAQNFLTDAERLAPAQEKLNDELHKLNLSADLTKDQFRDLVQSFGDVNGVSEETLLSLLSLAPAFVEVRSAQDQLADAAKQYSQGVYQQRLGLESQLLQLQGNTIELRKRELASIEPANRALQQHIYALQDGQVVAQNAAQIIQEKYGLETQLLQLQGNTTALRERELSALDPVNKALQEHIFALQDEQSAAQAAAQKSAQITQEKYGLETQLLQLQGNTTALRARELDALDESNRGILQQIFSIQDAQESAQNSLSGTDNARAEIDTRRDEAMSRYATLVGQFDQQIKDVTDSISKLTDLSDSLKSTLSEIQPMSRGQAKFNVLSAINTARMGGGLPDVATIKESLDTLSRDPGSAYLGSFEFAREKAKGAALIAELSALTDVMIAANQISVASLESRRGLVSVPAFAHGGFHRGGLRIVGERGPELESTGPSRIANNNDLAEMLSNDDVVAAIMLLIGEIQTNTQYNHQVARKLDAVTVQTATGQAALRTGT